VVVGKIRYLAHVPERKEDMSSYLEGQTHQLMESLERAGYTPAHVTALGQNSNGVLDQLMLVLTGVAVIVRHCLKLALPKVFNPTEFIGAGWTVWKGPADGNGLEGDEDCVPEPDVMDFEQIVLETHIQEGKTSVHGEEKMRLARAGKNQQLGGRAFLSLWKDWQKCKADGKPEESILEKLRRAKKIGNVIYFFGLTLRRPGGDRCVLCLYFGGVGWDWGDDWLGGRWDSGSPSVALVSVN